MAITPKFRAPDGKYREKYIFSTDVVFRFFTGQMDADTADMQVSIRDGGFTSNPDYIQFEGTSFTVPNPSAYPEGLQLLQGSNLIEVRSVLSNGETTSAGVIRANLSQDRDIKATVLAPSGVYLERRDETVKITIAGGNDPDITGYNFYAAISPGGGLSGYKRINLQPVISYDTEETISEAGTLITDSDVVVNDDGTPVADPLYFRVVGTQVDRSGTAIQTNFDEGVLVSDTATKFRTTVRVDLVDESKQFSFIHNRRATPSDGTNPAVAYNEFQAIPDEDPIYYTVTALYFIDGVEYESPMSQEVVGAPLIVTPQISNLPAVSRQQMVRDTTLSIFRSHPEVDVKPGSYLRDTFIDPFSTEAERIRFIVGFLQAAQSTATLLAIDDPPSSGISIPVLQSPYKLALKQAFYLQDTASTQNLIDNAFDHLAARRGVVRRAGYRARGEIIFYMTERPSTTRFIPLGTNISNGSIRFRTTSAASITATGVGTVYDPATGRWSVRAYIQALDAGSAGNLSAGQITVIPEGVSGVFVTNPNKTYGGRNTESNAELARRADGVLSSVDSGTYRGYVQKAADVPGVRQVNVVEAGHGLMMRDLDTETGTHWGGKVDVWVRGESLANVTDSFAFSFETVIDGQFEPVGEIGNLKFRAKDPRVTEENPIIEMLDIPDWNIEFKVIDGDGVTRVLDLRDADVIYPDGVQLSTAHNDPTMLHISNEFRASFRFRTSNKHEFERQPVTEIISFYRTNKEGNVDIVGTSAYKLFHPSDPLVLGRSTNAGDFLQVVEPTDGTTPENIPSGNPLVVDGENHVILQGPEYLNKLGINPYTVHVYNFDRSIEYNGPFHPTTDKDFSYLPEDGESPLAIVPVAGGRLEEGLQVIVDYQHDENYTVQYTTNSMVGNVQTSINQSRHCTADVVTKEAIDVGVNIQATVVLQKNQSSSVVDGAIRTNLGRMFSSLVLGQPLRQSDIIQVIENISGVSYAVVPLSKVSLQDRALVIREEVPATQEGTDWDRITTSSSHPWYTDNVQIFLVHNRLYSSTADGGGAYNEFRGVFIDDIPLILYATIPQYNGYPLKGTSNAACIIGNDGMNIPGYTGETSNRVLLALPTGTTPSDGILKVTYTAQDDKGVKNIEPGPTEYLVMGDLEFTYDEDRDFQSLVTGRVT